MKNEEAIAILEEFKVIDDWTMVHLPPMEDAVDKAIEALKAKTDGDTISRQSVVRLLVEKYKFTTAEAMEILDELPSTEPKVEDNTNANEIYNYLKERIDDIVDDMKEFDAWFERMVWHVKECDRLTAEPKTGKWIHGSYIGGPEYRRCNQCFAEIEESIFGFEYDVNYCPNCGCRMEEDKNDKG